AGREPDRAEARRIDARLLERKPAEQRVRREGEQRQAGEEDCSGVGHGQRRMIPPWPTLVMARGQGCEAREATTIRRTSLRNGTNCMSARADLDADRVIESARE